MKQKLIRGPVILAIMEKKGTRKTTKFKKNKKGLLTMKEQCLYKHPKRNY